MKRQYVAVIVALLFSIFLAGCGCGGSDDVGLVSIAVTPADSSIAIGTAQPFIATGTYSDNTTQDLTKVVTWNSSDTSVATISNKAGSEGWAAGIKAGSTTITATSGNISGTATLRVLPALVSIAVTPDNQSLSVGATQQYVATGTYSDGSTKNLTLAAVWSSTPAGVATVSNLDGSMGLATAVAAGSARISAESGGITGSAGLTVNPVVVPPVIPPVIPVLVSITVTPDNQILSVGATLQFAATGTYSDGSTKNITSAANWSSSPAGVATVSNLSGLKGLATAVAAGSARISAESGGITGSAGLTVNPVIVPPVLPVLVSIAVVPDNQSISVGATQQYAATGTYSDGSSKNITSTANWSSTPAGVATVSNLSGTKGLATAVAAGSARVSAESDGISGSAGLTVIAVVVPPLPPPVTLVSIKVTPENPWVGYNKTLQFTARGTFSNGSTRDITQEVVWSSSQENIATISNDPGSKGLATTDHEIGITTIKATAGSISGSTTLFDP